MNPGQPCEAADPGSSLWTPTLCQGGGSVLPGQEMLGKARAHRGGTPTLRRRRGAPKMQGTKLDGVLFPLPEQGQPHPKPFGAR